MRLHEFLEELEEMINDAEVTKDENARFAKLARANERYIALVKIVEPEILNSLLSEEEHKSFVKIGVTLITFMMNTVMEDK